MLNDLWDFFVDDKTRNLFVVMGVIVAVASIATARSLARKKQAADLLFASRGDSKLQDGAHCIEKYHEASDKNIRALADKDCRNDSDPKHIRYVLNHFELVSVGIQNGIYDECIIKECWCGIVTKTYDEVLPFIQASRQINSKNTIYQEFEWLALRWKKNPLKVKGRLQSITRTVLFWQ